MGMNVLIVGAGAREHALTWKALQSPLTNSVYCAPGNAATAAIAVNTGLQATDVGGIVRFVLERDVRLTVIGPEAAVAAGLADRLAAVDRLGFGPHARPRTDREQQGVCQVADGARGRRHPGASGLRRSSPGEGFRARRAPGLRRQSRWARQGQ